MSALQRRTLWRQGRNAWEAWSRGVLEKKKALEESGLWAVDWFGEGRNPETRAWLNEAAADFSGVEFGEQDGDFSGFLFPGPVRFDGARFEQADFARVLFAANVSFDGAQFRRDATFAGASFRGFSTFDDASFASEANFDGALFIKENNGPLSPSASFRRTVFRRKADFRASRFTGNGDFRNAQFAESARFDEAELGGEGQFAASLFAGLVSFCKTLFVVRSDFSGARFAGDVRFGEARFGGIACFDAARFGGEASFRNAQFAGEGEFTRAQFGADAKFDGVRFGRRANFEGVRFERKISFKAVRFEADGLFCAAHFAGDALFAEAVFLEDALFAAAHFAGPACFFRCAFARDANFQAMTASAAFVLAEARFSRAPAFHEASFRDPPRLDNLAIADPLRRFRRWRKLGRKDPRPLVMRWMKVAQDPDMSFRYRRLRRLATDASDHRSEQDFFAEELRCRRFWHERAFGKGCARFWLAWVYGGVSDFGRSMLRPFLAWTASVIAFALFYLKLGEAGGRARGAPVDVAAHPGFPGWPPQPVAWDQALHWLGEFRSWSWEATLWGADRLSLPFAASACAEGESDAVGEAFYLSLKNALVMPQWENDHIAQRVYGCLYGVRDGGPVTPLASSLASLSQMVMSVALIFLFVLALRNLLKVK